MRSSSTALRVTFSALATSLMLVSARRRKWRRRRLRPGRSRRHPCARACHNGQSFDRFLAELKRRAVAEACRRARSRPLAVPHLQPGHRQPRPRQRCSQLFTSSPPHGRKLPDAERQQHIKMHAAAFARAEKEYGVRRRHRRLLGWRAISAPTWQSAVLPSLVSLAYDCRRSERFQNETIAALKVVDRGDLSPTEMTAPGGELGQTQFRRRTTSPMRRL